MAVISDFALGDGRVAVGRDNGRRAGGDGLPDQHAVGEHLHGSAGHSAANLELQRVAGRVVELRGPVRIARAGVGSRQQLHGGRRGGPDIDGHALVIDGSAAARCRDAELHAVDSRRRPAGGVIVAWPVELFTESVTFVPVAACPNSRSRRPPRRWREWWPWSKRLA